MTSETLRDALVQAHSMVDYAFLCAAGDEDAQAECKRVLGVIQDALSSDSVDGDIGGDPVVKATRTDEDVERVALALMNHERARHNLQPLEWDEFTTVDKVLGMERAKAAISAMSSREAGLREAYDAAAYLIECMDAVSRGVPVRNLDEAWERYGNARAALSKGGDHADQ